MTAWPLESCRYVERRSSTRQSAVLILSNYLPGVEWCGEIFDMNHRRLHALSPISDGRTRCSQTVCQSPLCSDLIEIPSSLLRFSLIGSLIGMLLEDFSTDVHSITNDVNRNIVSAVVRDTTSTNRVRTDRFPALGVLILGAVGAFVSR